MNNKITIRLILNYESALLHLIQFTNLKNIPISTLNDIQTTSQIRNRNMSYNLTICNFIQKLKKQIQKYVLSTPKSFIYSYSRIQLKL